MSVCWVIVVLGITVDFSLMLHFLMLAQCYMFGKKCMHQSLAAGKEQDGNGKDLITRSYKGCFLQFKMNSQRPPDAPILQPPLP